MESMGTKIKIYQVKKYLRVIRPYLRDIVNDHKILKILKVHSINRVIDYETQFGECQLILFFLAILMRPVIYIQKNIIKIQ